MIPLPAYSRGDSQIARASSRVIGALGSADLLAAARDDEGQPIRNVGAPFLHGADR
jgi:hypothetical protein